MGYACPVCEVPQQDEEHLANHLAFTAMLHGDGHEAWLDEHVSGWSDRGPSELAARVADLADEAEFEAVFEDTTDGHGHDDGAIADPEVAKYAPAERGTMDAEAERILDEAREMTERMYGDEE